MRAFRGIIFNRQLRWNSGSRHFAARYTTLHTVTAGGFIRSVSEVNDEIDRYITWPVQALSYKIGELKIRELRAQAESELGSAFDLRGFHDTVVGNGSVPIAVLEEIVHDWVAKQKR